MSKEQEIKQPKPRKPPIHGMKWVKLGQGKDPEFEKYLLLQNREGFCGGFLRSIEQTTAGKKYVFGVTVSNNYNETMDLIYDNITHYCEPKPPVD